MLAKHKVDVCLEDKYSKLSIHYEVNEKGFEEDRYLVIYSGRKGAVKKKMRKIQKYVEIGE